MNKNQWAVDLVKDTFQSKFDRANYIKFIKSLLNEPDFTYSFAPRTGNIIPESFRAYVSSYERVAKYTDDEEKRVDILIVYLKRESTVERARSMQRNFIAGYLLGRYGSTAQKEAALVAFVAPNGEDWRFSLVKLETKLQEKEQGGYKAVDEFTPAKRWSFLVGSHEKSHTAQTQFVPIMEDTDNNPTLADLEQAFNIEKVTNEFFREYRRLFIATKDTLDKAVRSNPKTKADFASKGIDTVNLAKKLLGQIIFLYYLQKKGWFGVSKEKKWGDGSKNFLRELFDKKHGAYDDFFNDVLEPLFYEALRIDRSNEDYYYKRFKCRIPFLNGGLFDPMGNYDWEKTDIRLSNTLFSHKTKDDPEGSGILDVFDLYNFTVKEDEPFEREVAIDPELLGKAYEKFNAIRPDNYDEFLKALKSGKKGEESKFNKQYGVYYTPREIVHYMCQQSLINYLYSELNPNVVYQSLGDDQLDMFGNAVKGGQMDMSVEHRPMAEIAKEEIALLIQHGENWRENEERVETTGKETVAYSYKTPESIRENASLIDEKLATIKVCDPAVGSGAFPVGMMSEIVRARDVLKTWTKSKKTVYDFKRECIENSLYGVDIDAGAVEIAKLRLWLSLIVDEDDIQNIKPLPNLDYKVVCGNSLIGFPENWGSPIEKEIESLIHQHFNETSPKKKEQLKKQIDEKLEFRYKNSMKAFGYQVNFDFKTVFSEVFNKNGGFDIIIANPPYIQLSKVEGTPDWYKKYLKERFKTSGGRLNTFIFFIHLALNILRRRGNLAFIIPNTILTQEYYSATREMLLKQNHLKTVVQYTELPFEEAIVENVTIIASKESLPKYEIEIFVDDLSQLNLVERKPNTQFLGNSNFTINVNVDSLIEKVYSLNVLPLDEFCHINQAIALKGDRSLSLHTSNPKGKFYKKLDGRNIGRYYIQWDGVYLDWNVKKIHSGKNKDIYTTKEKLFFRRVSEDLMFAYDDKQYFALNTLVVINLKDSARMSLKCLLALLNSRLMNHIYKKKFKSTKTVFSEIQANTVGQLPIPSISNERGELLTKLIERILAAKRANPQADTKELEKEIDLLVYDLYGLTKEERDIVEGRA